MNIVDKIFIVGVLGIHLAVSTANLDLGPWIFLVASGILIIVTSFKKLRTDEVIMRMPKELYEKELELRKKSEV